MGIAGRISAVTTIVCGALMAEAFAQVRDAQQVEWSINFVQTEPQRVDSAQVYRIYGPRQSVEFTLSVLSFTTTPAVVSLDGLREAFSFRVFAGGSEIAATLEWEPTLKRDFNPPASHDLRGGVDLPAKGQLIFSVIWRRADGQRLGPGEYTIAARLSRFATALKTAAGAPWPGRAPEGTGTVTLRVVEPTNPMEMSAMHYLAGRDALYRRRSPRDAATRFELAVQADPANAGARLVLANTYVSLGQYRSAINTYEDLIKMPMERTTETLRLLALAYVADRDEAGATRVLREARIPDGEIARALSTLRERVAQLESESVQAAPRP